MRWGLLKATVAIRSEFCCFVCFSGPGLAPAGDLLSFASPKESKQRKGDPTVCDPFAALRGNLRCSRFAGSRRTRFAQTAASPDPRNAALLGAARGGWRQHGPLLRSAPCHKGAARLCGWCWYYRAERSEGLSQIPSGCAEERRWRRDQGRSCLSEASSADPRRSRAPQVARSEAEGRRQQGRLFFAYFLLAKQKKVSRPPGRNPAPERKTQNKS